MNTVYLRTVLVLLAGGLMTLAFAPFNLYPLSLLGLAVLFYSWLHASPRQAFLSGLLFGFAMFAGGVSWIFVSMYQYGNVSFVLSLIITLLFVSLWSLFPAVCGYIAVRCRPVSAPTSTVNDLYFVALLLPALWVIFEWIRGWFLSGFTWLQLGYSFIDAPLAGFAPVFGIYGVSLLAAISSGLILLALIKRQGEIAGVYLLLLLGLWGAGALLSHVEWTTAKGEPIHVSMVQGNFSQDLKWRADMLQPTLDRYISLSRAHWDSDLIIWPETAIPLFHYQAQPFVDSITAESRLNDTDLLVGLVYQNPETGGYYNSMLGLGIEGGRYDKHHLVPLTEYLPFKSLLSGLIDVLDVPMSDFSAGASHQAPLILAGEPIGISICFEDAFGEHVIRSLPQATMLVNVSNDAWFAGTIAPAQHLQMARMRALEAGRELMRATNTGLSAFIAANGRLRQVSSPLSAEVLSQNVQPRTGATPYVIMGNSAVLFIAVLMIIIALIFLRRSVKEA